MADIEKLEQVLAGVRRIDTETFTENAIGLAIEIPNIKSNFIGYGVEVGNKLLEIGTGLISALEGQNFDFGIKCKEAHELFCVNHFCGGEDCKKQISVRGKEILISSYHYYYPEAYSCSVNIIPHKTRVLVGYKTYKNKIENDSGICSFKKESPEYAFKILAEHYHPGSPKYIFEFVEEFLAMPLFLDSVVKEMRKGAQMQQALEERMEAIRRLGR